MNRVWSIQALLFPLIICGMIFSSPSMSRAENTAQRKVYVGAFLTDVSQFEINNGRFSADLVIWCKWLGKSEEIPEIIFANGEIDSLQEIARENEGDWQSVRWHAQGTFRGNFPLQDFPFDRQELRIEFGLPKEEGILVPDLAGSGMNSQFSITGWIYEPYFQAEVTQKRYASDFGSIANEGTPLEMDSVSFILKLERPMMTFIIKFLLPLAIIVGMAMLVFFITPDNLEANSAIGVTALLSCIAFHFTQADSLPDVPYMVAADKLFIASYAVIFLTLVRTVTVFNLDIRKKYKSFAPTINRYMGRILFIALIIGTGVFFSSLGKSDDGHPVVLSEGKRPVSVREELVFSIPVLSSLNTSGIIEGLLMRGLLHEKEGGEVTANLVNEIPSFTNDTVKFLPDGGAEVRWELTPGLKWGDGTPLTSDDLFFSIMLVEDPNREHVTVRDEQTIIVEYEKRVRSIVEEFPLYPKHEFEMLTHELGMAGIDEKMKTNPPPLDGPYLLSEFIPGKYAIFTRNPYFPGRRPLIETIRVIVLDKELPEKIRLGETDLAGNLSMKTYLSLKNDEGIIMKSDPSEQFYLLQPDLHVFPFSDHIFREALMYAIDRQKVAEILFGRDGKAAKSYRPEAASDYFDEVNEYPYDPEKAKDLISSLRITDPVELIISEGVNDSPEMRVVDKIRSDLENAGLEVIVTVVDGSTASLFEERNHGGLLYINRESELEEPLKFWNSYQRDYLAGLSDGSAKNLVRLVDQFSSTMFEERRDAISKKIQEYWGEAIPVIPLAFGVYRSVQDDALSGWDPKGAGGNIWWNVEDWFFVE